MAGKNHVDNTVAERRLRPIYDWLDNNNNKKALQEAEKVLKKQPNFLCAKVLKGLAFLRLGKEDECQTLLDAVRAEEPSDDSTLQAMSICYRELHQPHRVVSVYEAAVRQCPASEELLTHLFMAYVRVGDAKRQQQVAMTLYKLKPKNPYYFWAVMSIVMQARRSDGAAAAISLALAERMVVKLCNEGRLEAEQEVQLLLMILEMQGKTEEALAVLSGPLADKLVSLVSVPLKRAQLLVELRRWTQANVLYKRLLLQDINQWELYVQYLDTSFQLMSQSDAVRATPPTNELAAHGDGEAASDPDSELVADSSCEAMAAFLERLQSVNRRLERAERAPALARLELFRRMDVLGLPSPSQLLGEPVDLLIGYVLKFGERACCVSDLRPYLPLVPAPQRGLLLGLLAENTLPDTGLAQADDLAQTEESAQAEELAQTEELAQRLETTTLQELTQNASITNSYHDPATGDVWLPWELAGGASPESAGQMARHLTALQLARCLGVGAAPAELAQHADQLDELHRRCAKLGPPATATEFRPNDGYALLSAHVRWDAWTRTHSSDHLVLALAALARALRESPANFHCKLLQLKLLHMLGAGLAAHEVYQTLDVKHVQLDSMGHLHCSLLLPQGQLLLAGHLLDATLKFFTSNYRESIEHLTFSYKFGSFGKIEEFREFRERLNNSLHYAASTTEKMLLELSAATDWPTTVRLLAGMDVRPAADLVRWTELRDNRDLDLVVAWEPQDRCVADNGRAVTWSAELDFLRLRSVILRCAAAAANLAADKTGPGAKRSDKDVDDAGSEENALETLNRLLTELTQHCDKCQANPPAPLPADCISLPVESRIARWPWSATRALAALMASVAALAEAPTEAQADPGLEGAGTLAALVSALGADIAALATQEDPLARRRLLLESCANLAETLSLSALVCGARCALASPAQTPPARKNRRRNQPAPTATEPSWPALATLTATVRSLRAIVQSWASALSVAPAKPVESDECANVRRQIDDSHRDSLAQIGGLLDVKLGFLSALCNPR